MEAARFQVQTASPPPVPRISRPAHPAVAPDHGHAHRRSGAQENRFHRLVPDNDVLPLTPTSAARQPLLEKATFNVQHPTRNVQQQEGKIHLSVER
jgi:hypothetical protein